MLIKMVEERRNKFFSKKYFGNKDLFHNCLQDKMIKIQTISLLNTTLKSIEFSSMRGKKT